MTAEPVAVVGMGCIYPGAPDIARFWANVVAGVDAISDVPADRIDPRFFSDGDGHLTTARGGFVTGEALSFEPARFGIMPVAVDDAEPDQMMAIKTAAAALEDTDDLHGVARERIGVILGRGGYLTPGLWRLDQRVRASTQILGILMQLLPDVDKDRLRAVREEFVGQLGGLRPDSAIGLVPNLASSRIANRFDLGGPAYTVDAACASSLVAIDAALTELAAGRCDAVLAGGVHHCHDVTLWSVFSQLGALSPSGEIRPFSRLADGVLVSEGTGIVVLERLKDAVRLDHDVYALVVGTGVASDGRSSSLMSPRVDGQVLALERAYRAATVDPATVGLLEGHGTATPAGDLAELQSIRSVFGGHVPSAGPRHVLGSVKSNIGHAMPAAGAAGFIKSVLAVHHGVLPPTLHAQDPNPAVAQTRFRMIDEAELWAPGPGPRRSAVNAFGFGGINAHVIIEQWGNGGAPARSGRAQPSVSARPAGSHDSPSHEEGFELDAILLAGRDAAELHSQLRAISLDERSRWTAPSITAGPVRMAMARPTQERLALAARVLEQGRPWRGRKDIWFEPSGLVSAGGRLALLFPGIEPTDQPDLDDVAAWFGLSPPPVPPGARGIEQRACETFASGRLLSDALTALGVVPDDVAGQSLGEWTGLFSAELIPSDRGDSFLSGLEPGRLELPGVVFLALGCGVDTAAEVISNLEGVVVSHDNCPHQSIVCGPEAKIAEARHRFATRRVLTQELPFRSGFHTPYMAPYLDLVRRHWRRMPLQTARIPLWSATTCDRYPADPEAIRQLATEHLVKPVRFRELVETLYGDGVRVFVQMGAGSLVSFVDDTLRNRPQLSVAAAAAGQPGLEQLARAALALWVEGVEVQFDKLLSPVVASTVSAISTEPARGTRQLSLGTSLIRLPNSITLADGLRDGPSRPDRTADHVASTALRAEFDALLADTRSASESVVAALATSRTSRSQVSSRVAGGAKPYQTPQFSPPSGAPARPEPVADSCEERWTVGIEAFPWLADHCFYRQPENWPELSDRFPVVPMTTMIEMLVWVAMRLVPDMTVTCIEGTRAMRWLTGDPPTEVAVSARRVGTDRVEAALQGYAKGTVDFAPSPPPSPPARIGPLVNPRAAPADASSLYAEHWMFHGPMFQGVRSIGPLGDNGIDGHIERLPTPGGWLDCAGQLYGLWLMALADTDLIAFPQSIDRIEFFGAQPPPGESCATAVRIIDVTPRTVRADMELSWNGAVTVRITGWVDRRFDSDRPLWTALRDPEQQLVATRTRQGYFAVEERWRDSASRELMARRYLDGSERQAYERLNPRAQRLWLLSRIAAKDAVRHGLWSEGHGPLFPIEVPLTDDGASAVVVRGGPGTGRRVAIAQAPWIGVAATDATAIGVETVESGDRAAARHNLGRNLARSGPLAFSELVSPIHLLAGRRLDDPGAATEGRSEAPTSSDPLNTRKEYVVCRVLSS